MAGAREKARSFERRKGAESQREKVIPMSGVILEWKMRLPIDNRYSLSKAKPEPECPSKGSVIRARAALVYTYIQRRRKLSLFPTGAQWGLRCSIYGSVYRARLLFSFFVAPPRDIRLFLLLLLLLLLILLLLRHRSRHEEPLSKSYATRAVRPLIIFQRVVVSEFLNGG